MKRTAVYLFLPLLLFLAGIKGYTQVRITGPECIVPGTEYQYDFYGKWDKQSEINICVEGGFVVANNSTCYNLSGVNYVRIIWNDEISKGKISITSSSGNGSFNVKPTRALQGGTIDSLSKVQLVQSTGISRDINCSPARGGSCAPMFLYQWEQSDDNLRWTEITGAASQNLSFSAVSDGAVFLRRRIVDMVSNSIAYSDVAVIVVSNQPASN